MFKNLNFQLILFLLIILLILMGGGVIVYQNNKIKSLQQKITYQNNNINAMLDSLKYNLKTQSWEKGVFIYALNDIKELKNQNKILYEQLKESNIAIKNILSSVKITTSLKDTIIVKNYTYDTIHQIFKFRDTVKYSPNSFYTFITQFKLHKTKSLFYIDSISHQYNITTNILTTVYKDKNLYKLNIKTDNDKIKLLNADGIILNNFSDISTTNKKTIGLGLQIGYGIIYQSNTKNILFPGFYVGIGLNITPKKLQLF